MVSIVFTIMVEWTKKGRYTMEYKFISKWTRPENYVGPDFDEFFDVMYQNRDSDILDQSNFRSMLKKLGGESETVRTIRQGHWAVGWIEFIAIHETDKTKLDLAESIMKDYDSYPVIDESDYSDLEYTQYSDYAKSNQSSLSDFLEEVFTIPNEYRKDTEQLAYELNLKSQLQGNFRKTGDFETEELESLLNDLSGLEENSSYQYLKACLNLD
jgi:hypothetical protein